MIFFFLHKLALRDKHFICRDNTRIIFSYTYSIIGLIYETVLLKMSVKVQKKELQTFNVFINIYEYI